MWNYIQTHLDALATVFDATLTLAIGWLGLLINRKMGRLQALSLWKTHRDDIRNFGNSVVAVLSELEGLCERDPKRDPDSFFEARNQAMTHLSSLRDCGRFLLPNVLPHGLSQRVSAYQGIRDAALDAVTAAFYIGASIDYTQLSNNKLPAKLDPTNLQHAKLLKGLTLLPVKLSEEMLRDGRDEKGWSCKSALVAVKRQFVSEIQRLIEPDNWLEKMSAAAELSGRRDPMSLPP